MRCIVHVVALELSIGSLVCRHIGCDGLHVVFVVLVVVVVWPQISKLGIDPQGHDLFPAECEIVERTLYERE